MVANSGIVCSGKLKQYRFNPWFDFESKQYLVGRSKELPAFNPTIVFGVDLIADKLMPFIKRQLVRDNPLANPRITKAFGDRHEDFLSNEDVFAALFQR